MLGLSNREKYLVSNTLNCVPLLLKNLAVLIDLRNETSVAGRIESADGFMNIDLVEAVYIDRDGQQYPFTNFTVRQRMIRQIHIPNSVDIDQELRQWSEHGFRRNKPLRQHKGKRTFKQKRAEERHKETLREVEKQKQQQQQQREAAT